MSPSNSAIASTPASVRAADGGYLGQRVQESLLSGDPSEPGADARQHAIYLTAQMISHFCGPVVVVPAPPLTPSQVAARELVVEQDRAYEQAVRQDQRQNLSVVENTPAQVPDLADEEPSSEEMRRARLLRFGLPPR